MTAAVRCHFDGKVFIPDEQVDIPVNTPLIIRIESSTGGVHIIPPKNGTGTGAEIANSAAVGMWADREDITDSLEFARELRRRAERRGGDR